MSALKLECYLKGVKDESYGEGAEHKALYMAQVYAPGHGDFNIPISQSTYATMLLHPPMITKWIAHFTVEERAEVRQSNRTGNAYARNVTMIKWQGLEFVPDKKAS